jgi:hypothetical protein
MEPMVFIIGGGCGIVSHFSHLILCKSQNWLAANCIRRTVKAKRNAVKRATEFSCPIANRERTVVEQGF